MRRINWRLLRSVAALSLPTVVVLVLGVRFLVVDVPIIVRDEKARVLSSTEHAAKAMRDDHSLADFAWERGRGVVRGVAQFGDYPADMSWKDWNPESGTKRRDMWGWRSFDGGRLVWARGMGEKDGETVYARWTDIEERDYAFMFYLFGPMFLIVLVGITFLGARFFVDYVRSRDDFLAATAHDLTTPLVGMRYSIGRNDDEAKVLNERMIRLVANIKDFLRLGGKRPKPQREEVDLVKCYKEAYALFREDVRDVTDGSDLPVEMGTDPTEPLKNGTFAGPVPNFVAMGDETLVVQILWNLIGNDLKYALPFGPVRVRFFRERGFVCVEFADEGKGMSRSEMARAFDRYYRAKTVLESGKGGFGIGLCTAREFARAMGGDLSVRANSPHGCIFTLSLPAAKGGNEAVS